MADDGTPAPANEAERRRWNDARWTAAWPDRERLTNAVTPYLLRAMALQPGERVLDVGCGGGGLTLASAEAVAPEGVVVGADLSTALVDLARRRAADAGVSNASFAVVDVQSDGIDGGPFDVVASQFGVMFFEEPVAAFANMHDHLGPGGRLVFACWQPVDRNPWHTGPLLSAFLPAPQPIPAGTSAVGPFVLGDVAHTTALLEAGGFVDISSTAFETTVDAPANAVFDDWLLDYLGVPEARLAAAQAAADDHLARFHVDADRYRFPLAFLIFEASGR